MALFKIPKKPKEEKLARLSAAQKAQLDDIEANAIAEFQGVYEELEAAIGMLRIGHHVGWKVLYLVHSKRTVRKYEEILGVKIREIFPEEGPSSYRSRAYMIAQGWSNFWKGIAGGEEKIEGRRNLAK